MEVVITCDPQIFRPNLTAREIDVLRLIAAGNANKNIADQLAIGEATVKTHVTNILSKLGGVTAADQANCSKQTMSAVSMRDPVANSATGSTNSAGRSHCGERQTQKSAWDI
jgi:DNA-binding CsgD family transcriptional regulator